MLFFDNVIPSLIAFLNEGQKIALATLVSVDGILAATDGQSDRRRRRWSVRRHDNWRVRRKGNLSPRRVDASRDRKTRPYAMAQDRLISMLSSPCGAGIDIYIETQMSADIVRDIHLRQKDRTLAFMGVDLKRLDSRVISAAEASASAHDFVKIYEPDYRIFAFGEGANLVSLCMLASAAGFTVHAFSPDEDALSFLDHTSIEGTRIHRKTNFAAMPVDDYTAVVTLFHEHEWERDILHAALNSPAGLYRRARQSCNASGSP